MVADVGDPVAPPASPSSSIARVVSVNVGLPRTVQWHGRAVTSAIWKEPVDGPVTLRGVNLDGDDQADRRVHGGRDKAVYAYSVEDYAWWASTVGSLEPGTFGENLTISAIDVNSCAVGDRWHVGTAVLEVAQPRSPCFKLGIRMGDDDFPGRFEQAHRPGAYLRIVGEGSVTAGDEIRVVVGEQPAVTIGDFVQDDIPLDVLALMTSDPRVPTGWRTTAARAIRRR